MTLPYRKFGVEIEFVGITPSAAAEAITRAGVSCFYEDYNHAVRGHWKVVTDSSVQPSEGMPYGTAGELVSPPLVGVEGMNQLHTVVTALKAAGASVNKTCGLHVHVDANDLNAGQILSVVRRYAHFETQINAFMPPSRRNGRWAYSVGGNYVDDILTQVNRSGNVRGVFGGLNRYMAVNLASYARHGTVEFRQHSGSVNAEKIKNWVKFCLHFVTKAITATVLPVPSVTPEPTVSTPAPIRRRGRPPNYQARRELIRLLTTRPDNTYGIARRDLAAASGFAESRLTRRGQIFSEINSFATVIATRWNTFRITEIHNREMMEVWLGNVQSTDPALDARTQMQNRTIGVARVRNTTHYMVPRVADSATVFEDMPVELATYYMERTRAFA
jgi:hypothetical protein